jgi:hypothetical protein
MIFAGKYIYFSGRERQFITMCFSVTAETWATLDPWWETFVETTSVVEVETDTRRIDDRWFDGMGSLIDQWWNDELEGPSPQFDSLTATLEPQIVANRWETLDPWWETFRQQRQDDAEELAEELRRMETVWAASESNFDTDPLATDWSSHANTRGPMRPGQEENWSQWLAHLLRTAQPQFIADAFGVTTSDSPTEVCREEYLPAIDPTMPDRYADIILWSDEVDISIEVKTGDDHYRKTPHTAGLLETKHDKQDWQHYLLVRKHELPALKQTFPDRIEETADRPQIIGEHETPQVTLIYWEDISSALRTCLLDATSPTQHWAASAFAFITLIEQKLLDFTPQPTVERLAEASPVISGATSLAVAAGDVTTQLNYLQSVEQDTNDK